jgi:predicted transposase YdaD
MRRDSIFYQLFRQSPTLLGIELEQTRVYREAEQQGELKGQQELVLRQLNRRVGNMSSQLQERIKSLPLTELEALGEALLDFTSMADLEAWLTR